MLGVGQVIEILGILEVGTWISFTVVVLSDLVLSLPKSVFSWLSGW